MKLAVASGKGGVGKSMVASALAMLFARNHQVIAVDCDVDAPNLHLWLGGREDWDSIEKISTNERPVIGPEKCNLCGKCVDICAFGALEVSNVIAQFTARPKERGLTSAITVNPYFCEGCGACEMICPQKAITMIPVENAEIRIKQTRHGFPLVSAQLYPGETGSGKIVDAIKERAEKFDHQVKLRGLTPPASSPLSAERNPPEVLRVGGRRRMIILDSPAGTGCPVIAALKDANFVALVTEPTPSGLADLKRVLTVVDHFKIPYGVVINKWDIYPQLAGKIEKEFASQMLGKISYDQKIFQAIARLTPIMETDLPVKDEVKAIFAKLSQMID